MLYDNRGNEIERILLDVSVCNFGCVIPVGVWYTVVVLEPSVLYEVKEYRYGEEGAGSLELYQTKEFCQFLNFLFSTH